MTNKAAAIVCDVMVATLALGMVAAAFFVADPAPYLFPRLIAIALLALCAARLFVAFRAAAVAAAPSALAFRKIAPAIVCVVAYVSLAETVGFYCAAAAAFFAIAVLYGVGPLPRRAFRAAAAAVLMTGILWLLFSLLLRAQTPRGWLF